MYDYFIFSHTPCMQIPGVQFPLKLYYVGASPDESPCSNTPTFIEERLNNKPTPLHYGATQNEPLKFNMTFGIDADEMNKGNYLSQNDIIIITSWLTKYKDYQELEIYTNTDIVYRYKSYISRLSILYNNGYPYAFRCEVTCDSPFGYTGVQTYCLDYLDNESGVSTTVIHNPSSFCGYYRPTQTITVSNVRTFEIANETDGRTLKFKDIPLEVDEIFINNDKGIISCKQGLNLYQYSNLRFLRFLPGDNKITTTNGIKTTFQCEFPIHIGGWI